MNIIVRQRDIKDCGVCCIQSLIIYYGGYVSLERLRLDTYQDTKGITAYHIVETLKKYQFKSFGEKVKEKDLNKILLPCIVHFEYPNGLTHFVVLLKVNNSSVVLMDPAKGKVTMKKKEFLSLWTKVVIHALPISKIPSLPKEKKMLTIFYEYLKNEKKLVMPIVWFSFLFTLCTIFLSFFYKFCFEEITKSYSYKQFIILVGFYAFFTILKILLDNIKENFKILLNKNMEGKFLYAFLKHLLYLPVRQYNSHTKGELLARIKEAEGIENSFIEIVISCFVNFTLAIITFILIFTLKPIFSYILIIGIMLYFLLGYLFGKSIYLRILKQMEENANWNTVLTESLEIFTSMKNLNQTNFILERVEQSLYNYLKREYDNNQTFRKQNFYKKMVLEIMLLTITIVGFYFIGQNKMNIFEFILIESLLNHFIEPLRQIIDLIPSFYYLKGLFGKIGDFESLKEEALDYPHEFLNGSIECKNLTFSYDGYHENIKDVNFKIKKGSHVLLLGESGCGKSTICKIIDRQLDNFEGNITIKKVNILDYSTATIRNNITYLSQNESLINGTIKENILFGRDIKESTFNEVCDICNIEDIVKKRAFRFNDYIRIDDCNLSGGERQRILLARALLNESPIYMFDEALSEVNNDLEINIIDKLLEYLKKKTVIYITHRPNIECFDEVITIGN